METTDGTAAESTLQVSLISGLRELAHFIERHPELPWVGSVNLNAFAESKEHMARLARIASWRKERNGEWFMLRRTFPGGVTLDVNINRSQVCERVVIGQRVVPATAEHTEDVVEWKCDDSLLSG